jgi:hypothetical protein
MASVSKTATTTPGQAKKALASYFTHNETKRIQMFADSRGIAFSTAYATLRSIAGADYCKKGDARRVRRGFTKAATAATETAAA